MEFKKLVLTDLMIPAMKIDSYASSHPISTSANTPNEIREIFDTITYNKGNCMVQMLLNYLGEDHFRKGLQRYLTTYSYKNADQDDLWEELRYIIIFNLKSLLSFPIFFRSLLVSYNSMWLYANHLNIFCYIPLKYFFIFPSMKIVLRVRKMKTKTNKTIVNQINGNCKQNQKMFFNEILHTLQSSYERVKQY